MMPAKKLSRKDTYAEFLAKFPETHAEYRCFVDSVDGYSSCVWDEDSSEGSDDCSVSRRGIKKDDCEYWRKATIHNQYCPDELWEWMNSALSSQSDTSEIETSSHGKVRLAPEDMQRHECCACLELFTPWPDGDEMNTILCRACALKERL